MATQTLIHAKHFVAPNLLQVVQDLVFLENQLGMEVKDFEYISPQASEQIKSLLEGFEPSSSVFRKPHPFIHFEDCSEDNQWLVVAALDYVVFRTWRHLETGFTSALEVPDVTTFISECFKPSSWAVVNTVIVSPGDCLCFRPWEFHSIETSGIVHMFYTRKHNVQN